MRGEKKKTRWRVQLLHARSSTVTAVGLQRGSQETAETRIERIS